MPELGSPNTGPPVKWYRGRVPLRAIFFDAGNTLVRIDYAAIAAALAGRGVTTTAEALMRAHIGNVQGALGESSATSGDELGRLRASLTPLRLAKP